MIKKLEISVSVMDKNSMYLHTGIGNGDIGEIKVVVNQTIPPRAFVIELKEKGKTIKYVFDYMKITKALLDSI